MQRQMSLVDCSYFETDQLVFHCVFGDGTYVVTLLWLPQPNVLGG